MLKERRNVGLQCCDLSQVEDFEVGRGALKPHGSSNVEIFALKLKPHGYGLTNNQALVLVVQLNFGIIFRCCLFIAVINVNSIC